MNIGFQWKRRMYEFLPASLLSWIRLVPFGLIAGKSYRKTLTRNTFFDKATREEIVAYKEGALREVLRYAVNQVPAYHAFREAVENLPPRDALKEFPLLEKDELQRNMGNYLPRDFGKIPHYECSTGGTSGNQLKFYVDDNSQAVETAFMHRQWARVGYTTKSRKATFRGVAFPELSPGTYWQHNPIYNELQFSPFHMTEETLPLYIKKICRYSPAFFHGYPSAIDNLAEYVLRNSLVSELPPVKAVLLGSEGCLPGQRERIEAAFQTRAFSWYGHSERIILAGECERSSIYHQFPDYGYLEIIGDDGTHCDNEGERGELVGTGFLNRSLPLIRYRTGDYATRHESKCECGRFWDRFADVQGRWNQEMIIGRNGARISIAALNMHGPLFEKVIRYQYAQELAGSCRMKLMVAPDFTEGDRLAIENAYKAKVGDELEWKVEIVESIPLTERGKLKLLVTEVV